MADSGFVDYYELLQISPNAEPETIQQVYKMWRSAIIRTILKTAT
jgi:hypothetical protein